MQKAYSRINWQNKPSTETALGANNLNKVDKSLDMIDDRVLSLYGYESRVAESEKNAKTSETNAKQSELKAKEYAEHAFSGTPDGYDKLVEDVRLMDIQTTTDTTLANSKAGGYKLVSMSGASEQKQYTGKNLFDVFKIKTSSFTVNDDGTLTVISSGAGSNLPTDNALKDIADLIVGETYTLSANTTGSSKLIYLHGSAYYWYFGTSKVITQKDLDGSVSFYSNGNSYDTTAVTVSDIQLEKGAVVTKYEPYVGGIPSPNPDYPQEIKSVENPTIKTVGKNLLNPTLETTTSNGITITNNGDGTYTLNGTVTTGNFIQFTLLHDKISAGTYKLVGNPDFSLGCSLYFSGKGGESIDYGKGAVVNFSSDETIPLFLYIPSGVTLTNVIFKPMLTTDLEATYDDFEQYKETVATVLLNEPLRDGDILTRTEVVRKRKSVVFDGSDDEGWYAGVTATSGLYRLIAPLPNLKSSGDYVKPNIISSHYKTLTPAELWTPKMGISVGASTSDILVYDENFNTSDASLWKAHLQSNPLTVEYELAEEVIETLNTDSQIALNSLETFDTVTYINVDSRVQPSEIRGEYGTSKVGAYTLKSLLNSESNAVKLNELATAIVAL